MTKANESRESSMLVQVRRWRGEVYEARQNVDAREQARRTRELLDTFGLKMTPPDRGSRRSTAA